MVKAVITELDGFRVGDTVRVSNNNYAQGGLGKEFVIAKLGVSDFGNGPYAASDGTNGQFGEFGIYLSNLNKVAQPKVGDRVRINSNIHQSTEPQSGKSAFGHKRVGEEFEVTSVETGRYSEGGYARGDRDTAGDGGVYLDQLDVIEPAKPTFKVGDRVSVVGYESEVWNGPATVTDAHADSSDWSDYSVQLDHNEWIGAFPVKYIEPLIEAEPLIAVAEPKFKVGDRIVGVEGGSGVTVGKVYTVTGMDSNDNFGGRLVKAIADETGAQVDAFERRFELFVPPTPQVGDTVKIVRTHYKDHFSGKVWSYGIAVENLGSEFVVTNVHTYGGYVQGAGFAAGGVWNALVEIVKTAAEAKAEAKAERKAELEAQIEAKKAESGELYNQYFAARDEMTALRAQLRNL